MQVYSIQCLQGKNVYSHRPVIKMVVNIGDLHDKPTKDIEGFNEKILDMFNGLYKHHCSLGYEGGFVERLKEGTYIGHVTEHLILELQSMMGYDVCYGKTRLVSEPSIYYIVYEYENEKCAIECGKAGIDIVSSIAEGKDIDIENILMNIKKIAAQSELGPSTKAIAEEAKRRGIPIIKIDNESFIQLGYGKHSTLMEAALPDTTNCISVDIASDKDLTKRILSDYMIPTPKGEVVQTEQEVVATAKSLGYPVAVKPYNGNQGKGVILNINNEEQLKNAYNKVKKINSTVIVEKFIQGDDYRILVVGDKVCAVSRRRPPLVVGDGIHTIKELVQIENTNPLRGDGHEKPLTKINLDHVAIEVLNRKYMKINHIPKKDEIIALRDNGNLSTGGTAEDCTDIIHPYNRMIAIKAAKVIGLDIAGIDMTITDISMPINESNGAIIEVNAAPGLRMHLYPSSGKSRNVARDIINMLYPEDRPSSIPIISITGTNGKTTTTRLVSHTLTLTGKKVGMTSTSGIYIGNECILKGDNTGPVSARMVLSNKEVEVAVLETARGGIVRKGLGYDFANVGVITNISEDHIGVDGLNSAEDLAFVKSLVIEAVRPEGCAVVNADDEMAEFLLQRIKCNVMLFSKQDNNKLVLKHIEEGKKAAFIRSDILYIHDGKTIIPLIDINEVPITFGGILECNIENSLAAASTLYALEVPISFIKTGLLTFMPDTTTNPGRFNVFDMGNFKVMLDYCHNPAGYRAVTKFVQKMGIGRTVGIIGMPGDRLNTSIQQVGKLCAKTFSKIYIKEDNDLRGRKKGEVADILYDAVMQNSRREDDIKIMHSELKALETAMLDAQPDDLIVLLYEDFEPAFEMVKKFKKEFDKYHINHNSIIDKKVIIAREYEIPAVVGIPPASGILKDGQKVSINGENGVVAK